ncbi:phage holin family protein [Demequina aurantiaca]|uniref:phage holin family protein n=1 Tax=Demequina aurantiaca TaxID=676200 RepID=UPI003D346805
MAEQVPPPKEELSTGELIARLSEQTSTLVRDEIRLAQAELESKAKHAGIGLGLFGGGGLFAFFALAAAIATAIVALAIVLPAWLSCLIVTVLLLVIAGVMALVGKKQVAQAKSLKPEKAIDNLKQDVTEVKEQATS